MMYCDKFSKNICYFVVVAKKKCFYMEKNCDESRFNSLLLCVIYTEMYIYMKTAYIVTG